MLYLGHGVLWSLFSPWLLVRRSNITSTLPCFSLRPNSLTGLTYQPYHPLSLESNCSFFLEGTIVCYCSHHMLERESREKDLRGSAVQNVTIQFPPCWQPHSLLLLFELVDSTWADFFSEVLDCSFLSSLFSFNLLPFSLNQFPPTLWFASGLFSYLPGLLGFYSLEDKIKQPLLPFQCDLERKGR